MPIDTVINVIYNCYATKKIDLEIIIPERSISDTLSNRCQLAFDYQLLTLIDRALL